MPTVTCPDCKKSREIVRIGPNHTGRCHKCAQAEVDRHIKTLR